LVCAAAQNQKGFRTFGPDLFSKGTLCKSPHFLIETDFRPLQTTRKLKTFDRLV